MLMSKHLKADIDAREVEILAMLLRTLQANAQR
jgi:predicted nucleotidyltransferase